MVSILLASAAEARVSGHQHANSRQNQQAARQKPSRTTATARTPLRRSSSADEAKKARGRHFSRTGSVRKVTRPHTAHGNAKRSVKHATTKPERPLIVIDPGHGGRDPGAIGVAGTPEKKVVLATALELRRLLLATGRYRVVMTRTTDVFVSLADRLTFARSCDAALLIAIHANASSDRQAHGASVWVRSDHGRDGLTHLVTEPSDTLKISDALTGLKASARPGSAQLQYTMIDNLDDDIGMEIEPARQAPFYVLSLRDIPSVLLEMGFLSNRSDEALLNRTSYRRILARAIRDAIGDYFAKLNHPDRPQT